MNRKVLELQGNKRKWENKKEIQFSGSAEAKMKPTILNTAAYIHQNKFIEIYLS